MTTPPTNAEIDAFLAADNGDGCPNLGHAFSDLWNGNYDYFSSVYANALPNGGVMWVVGYADSASAKHYEIVGFSSSGSGSDSDIEANSLVTGSGGEEFAAWYGLGSPQVQQRTLGWLYALKQAYESITLRGYVIPSCAISALIANPVDSAVETWVNDSSNWAAAG